MRSHCRIIIFALLLLSPIGAYSVHTLPGIPSGELKIESSEILKREAKENSIHTPEWHSNLSRFVLRDFEERVDDHFDVPTGLIESAHFWLRIYTEFSSQQSVIFDRKHPAIIYEVVDFRELAKTSRNRIAYAIERKRKLRRVMANYRRAFDALAQNSAPKSKIQRNIMRKIRRYRKHGHSFATYRKNLRAQTGQRDAVIAGLQRMEPHQEYMAKVFKEYEIPSSLMVISLVESSFNDRAISRAGAKGVWQFMLPTAKEFLTVYPKAGVDERLSPYKSTVAAAKLLKRNYKVTKDWASAIIAYNSGFRWFFKTPKKYRQQPEKALHLCTSNKLRLGYAGTNYYSEFLAMLYATQYRHLFYEEFSPKVAKEPKPKVEEFHFRSKELEEPATGLQIAFREEIPLSIFRKFNPDIRKLDKKLPKGFEYFLPRES